ncbi:hypothetical protein [Serratia entomophila]|uniref:Uncharacterized protein n=1 Tax=Serratia entomophila TaxID=42906 RepID=A0ABY5CSV0_9GAMM|nr:hypothetical protein [Serratia entomophila]USV01047.1 hypothetical protein KFQ06_00320 [Serratia entomophila]CAI1046978.1 Uncharacterised protein [Serratia entomophila]CAI1050868.1 Uncharacterised protein [Serratia entomophila]CAI1059208.1 Uncharacterised protein [Serratia entomophila]CAI1059297.1 Uncharacterised protein [Serratia entomophila]
MMQLTLGRQSFTLNDNDALFVAEAILLQRQHPDIVLPEHRSDKHGVIRLTSRQAEPYLFYAGPVPLSEAAADTHHHLQTGH